jgi:hypothetical protein
VQEKQGAECKAYLTHGEVRHTLHLITKRAPSILPGAALLRGVLWRAQRPLNCQ